MTRPWKTASEIRADLRARIDSYGLHATATLLRVYTMTLYRALHGDLKPSLVEALGLTRGYRNGRGAPISEDLLRERAHALATERGGFQKAGKALKVSGSTLYYFASGLRPPSARILQALGYETVYFPKKTGAKKGA